MDFLDRQEELGRLGRLFDSEEGALACLYGRRRCGKTRLLRESTANRDNVFYHLADKSDKPSQMARFVQPNLSRQDFLEGEEERGRFEQPFSAYLGEVWERLVRDSLVEKGLPGFGGVRNVARWWGTGTNQKPMELDVVAESADGEALMVGEAKLRLSAVEAEHAKAELEAKARLLPFASRYRRIVTRLFVAADAGEGRLGLDWIEGRGK